MDTTPVARGRSGFQGESRRQEPDTSPNHTQLVKIERVLPDESNLVVSTFAQLEQQPRRSKSHYYCFCNLKKDPAVTRFEVGRLWTLKHQQVPHMSC
jgi:hypothetical protein